MTNFDEYLNVSAGTLSFISLVKAILLDVKEALYGLPRWEKYAHIFWLLGPFILLIERTPADAWVTLLAITFLARTIIYRDGEWLNHFWVRAGFAHFGYGVFLLVLSRTSQPTQSARRLFGFAFRCSLWLHPSGLLGDKRLLYAMLLSTATGLVVMCMILTAEVLIEGQKGGRLMWPYGDLVPGNYVAKVGLPAFTIMVALAVSVRAELLQFLALSHYSQW